MKPRKSFYQRLKVCVVALGLTAVASTTALVPGATPASAAPIFKLPFQCGTTWSASTYSGHSGNGTDFNQMGINETGSPVLASAAGTAVVRFQAGTGYGNYVDVDHGSGWMTRYAHLASAPTLTDRDPGQPGIQVHQGDQIGAVGSSGSSDVHLHYEQRLNGAGQVQVIEGTLLTTGVNYNSADPKHVSTNCGSVNTPVVVNSPDLALLGVWTFGSRQGFAYVTRAANGGFDVAVQKPNGSQLEWQGVWWSQTDPLSSFETTRLIPGDWNGDGLTDLYVIAPTVPNSPSSRGLTIGVMQNNAGVGFTPVGTVWSHSLLKMNDIKFIPGNWVTGARQGFMYVTKDPNGSFVIAIMKPSGSQLEWQGVWWNQTNPDSSFETTEFVAGDWNGDDLSDLYFLAPNISNSPSNPGLTIGVRVNDGVALSSWGGTVWSHSVLKLDTIKLLQGNWVTGARQGFMYVTKDPNGSFVIAIMKPSGSQLEWQGVWWNQTNPDSSFETTRFVPGDWNGDGLTDLYFAAPSTPNAPFMPGFAVGVRQNTGEASSYWVNTVWSSLNLRLSETSFIS